MQPAMMPADHVGDHQQPPEPPRQLAATEYDNVVQQVRDGRLSLAQVQQQFGRETLEMVQVQWAMQENGPSRSECRPP